MKIIVFKIFRKPKKLQKRGYYTSGNIRLGIGLYKNLKDTERYIQKSLKRRLS